MSKYLIGKYRRELKAYTFPEDKYAMLIENEPRKNEVFNETFNRSIFINTPTEFYLNNGNIIYYNSLREVNSSIDKWIEVFNMQTKFTNNNLDIYSYYITALSKIRTEIQNFSKRCAKKYNLKFATSELLSDTLVKVYINILWERKLQINNKLRMILDFYYKDYAAILSKIYDTYSTMILGEEEENSELYNKFKNEIDNILSRSKTLVREKKEE